MKRRQAVHQLYNTTKAISVAGSVDLALSQWSRMKGLLGKKEFSNKVLVIKPCRQVHTWFMRFPIDVLFIDDKNEVIAKEQDVKPWSLSKKHRKARAVIEAEVGVFSDDKVSIGDVLTFEKVNENE